jgi:hypothetical protein
VYRINKGVGYSLTDITGTALTGSFPPTFTDDGTQLIIANGGAMVYTDGYVSTAAISDTDAPTSVTHVAFLDTYILAKDFNTDTWYYSAVGDYSTWSALNFATAEASPDVTVSMIVHNQEILHFGKNSLENWYNDGSTPFSRNAEAQIGVGCSAPYSVVVFNRVVYFLSNNRVLNRLSTVGRNSEGISGKAVEKYIQGLSDVEDAVAFGANIAGRNFYIINFLKANVSLAYDAGLDSWYQIGKWNTNLAEYDAFIGRCHCYAEDWGMHLLGSRLRNGKIYHWSTDYHDEDGDPLRIIRRTGNVNHGTKNRKRTGRTYFRIKRGKGDPSETEPHMSVKIRGDNKLLGNKRLIGLGNTGDSNIVEVESDAFKGIHRNRQWNFHYSDDEPFVMADAIENVEAMRR